jgi:hypothetical protein
MTEITSPRKTRTTRKLKECLPVSSPPSRSRTSHISLFKNLLKPRQFLPMNQWIVTDFMERLNIRKLTAVAVAFVLCAAPQTRGVNAYLKQTSPSPLRFNPVGLVNSSFVLPESLVERQTPPNTNTISSAATTTIGTNAAVQQQSPSVPASNPVLYTTANPQNSTTATPPASDMLPVSPQMLTEFFKPVADGTNSPGTVVVPVPVGFTPPSATPPSRATYHSP